MSLGSKKQIRFLLCIFGVLFTVGLSFMGLAGFLQWQAESFKVGAETTEARITKIIGDWFDSAGTAWVEYTVAGKRYEEALNMTLSSMREGQYLQVYYHAEDPDNVMYLDESDRPATVFLWGGALITGIGVLVLFFTGRRVWRVRRLMASGRVLEAEVIDIEDNEKFYFNDVHPLIVICRHVTPGGKVYLFRSDSEWCARDEIDPGKKVRVYVDRCNPDSYYVNVGDAQVSK